MQSILFRSGVVVVLLILLCSLGCSSSEPPPQEPAPGGGEAASGGESPSARTLSIPGQEPAPTAHLAVGPMHWSLPEGWVEETPSSSMRLAQYLVPGAGGNAQCVVFYFGPGQGGDPMSNARRWAGQFTGPDGAPLQDFASEQLGGTKVPVMIVEVRGTYMGGMTGSVEPAQPQPGSMLLGAIVEGADAPWFFKFTGPETTVEAQKEAFIALLRSIHPAENA